MEGFGFRLLVFQVIYFKRLAVLENFIPVQWKCIYKATLRIF